MFGLCAARSDALAATLVACGGGVNRRIRRPSRRRPARTPVGPEGRREHGRRREGHGRPRRHRAEERADQDERRPGLRASKPRARRSRRPIVVGSDGKTLGNVFVYVKDGLGNYVFDTPTEIAEDRPEGLPLHVRTCSACASASRSRSSTAIRRCTTSTRCRRRTPSSTPASRSRA